MSEAEKGVLMKRFSFTMFTVLTLGLVGLGLWNAQTSVVQAQDVSPINEGQAFLQDELNTIDVIETFGPSVVAINVEVRGEIVNPFSQFQFPPNFQLPPGFEDFFNQQQNQNQDPEEFRRQGSGSGFLISEQGQIITNYHVVEGALQSSSSNLDEDARITVSFPNLDEDLEVNVIGVNPDFDLALLEVNDLSLLPENLNPIRLANSDELKVGQKVIAIGNPFGLSSTVTSGIVSAISREVPSIGRVEVPMVQTDAAINPGNSGGPLLNSRGELVGINTAIIPGRSSMGNAGNIGIGFAVPSNLLNENLEALVQGGVSGKGQVAILGRPRIGITITSVDAYPDDLKTRLDLPEAGAIVTDIAPDGPGAKAGLRTPQLTVTDAQGAEWPADPDIIIEVNGQEVRTNEDIINYVLESNAGDELSLQVWNDGEVRTVTVVLEVVN